MAAPSFIESIAGMCSQPMLDAISNGYRTCFDERRIQGLSPLWYDYDGLCKDIKDNVERAFVEYGVDAHVIRIELHGSRLRGMARDDSDLDAVVEYEGSAREDHVFNLLHDPEVLGLSFDGIPVDINPIKASETGCMADYMAKSAEYDREMLRNSISGHSSDYGTR